MARRGCLFPVLALVLIGALAAVVLWPLVVQPYLGDRARAELRQGIATEIAVIDPPVVPASGELVLTEAELNADLQARSGSFGPIRDPRIEITDDELQLTFSLYGFDNAVTGRPAVEGGRIVLLDAAVDGPAASILPADDATALINEQLTALLRQTGVNPTGIDARDGELVLEVGERE